MRTVYLTVLLGSLAMGCQTIQYRETIPTAPAASPTTAARTYRSLSLGVRSFTPIDGLSRNPTLERAFLQALGASGAFQSVSHPLAASDDVDVIVDVTYRWSADFHTLRNFSYALLVPIGLIDGVVVTSDASMSLILSYPKYDTIHPPVLSRKDFVEIVAKHPLFLLSGPGYALYHKRAMRTDSEVLETAIQRQARSIASQFVEAIGGFRPDIARQLARLQEGASPALPPRTLPAIEIAVRRESGTATAPETARKLILEIKSGTGIETVEIRAGDRTHRVKIDQ